MSTEVTVEIRRKKELETKFGVGSEVYVDGVAIGFGLEPARVNPVIAGHPCIPAGTYDVKLTMSPHLKYLTPEVQNVPGRTHIRWHVANYPRQLLGCMAPGKMLITKPPVNMMVTGSLGVFTKLMALLKGTDKITGVYTEEE